MTPIYKRVHVVINPASGKDQPILNVLNDVFHQHEVQWDCTVTHKYGDATAQAKAAIAAGVDLIAGYGGDGTQHEIANAVLSSQSNVVMGVLPGGTGNGFARELGISKDLREAVELICTSSAVRRLDAARLGEQFFIQRLYTGVEPEEQTSRDMKDRYGVMAYAMTMKAQDQALAEAAYRLTIDGKVIEMAGTKCYVVNSGTSGSGLKLDKNFSTTDGLLDVFIMNKHMRETVKAAVDRFLNLNTKSAGLFYWQGRDITIETTPDRPVWADGEYIGRTPMNIRVLPGALPVVVPANA